MHVYKNQNNVHSHNVVITTKTLPVQAARPSLTVTRRFYNVVRSALVSVTFQRKHLCTANTSHTFLAMNRTHPNTIYCRF